MRFGLLLLSLMACAALADQPNDDWRRQSFKQSKHLPDLHHAVDVDLLKEMRPPVSFELKDGKKLQCKTCHGLDKMDEQPYDKIDKKNRDFLRGGPYRDLEQFCYNCHNKKDHERPNIHVLLDKKGEIVKQNCLYCHKEVHEKRDTLRQTSELQLRLPAETLCLGCHLKTPHLNAVEHDEAKPKDEMKKHMKAQAERHGIILPLSGEGKVMCVSCHAPHPEGVMAAGNPAGKQVKGDVEKGIKYEDHPWDKVFQEDKRERLEDQQWLSGERFRLPYQRIVSEVLLRMPAKDGSLCLSCHSFEK